jgi:two-component system, probable response regulator PhcQ
MSVRVLFVDDDAMLLESIARMLRREPYEIHTATSAEEALSFLKDHSVDAVVADEQMPGMPGTAFLKRVREQYPDTVRFILTGKATMDLVIEAVNSGGISRFFLKPCDTVELSIAIRQGLQQRQLMLAARRLLNQAKKQESQLEKLEQLHPNIAHVDWDEDGAIKLPEWDGDPGSLMREICDHLEKAK